MSYKNKNIIKNDICVDCSDENSTIHYSIRSWVGEYKDICYNCFKKKWNN